MNPRRIFAATLLCLCVAAAPSLLAAERPNVLFIAVDDMSTDIGCYGNAQVKTPHIDALARRGVRFDRAYTQYPLCSPSRTSLMTGRRPDATRVFDLQKHFRDVIPDVTTLPQLYMRNGYFAARVGKIYHYGNPGQIGTAGLDDPASWNVAINPRGRDKDEEHLLTNHTPKRGLGSSLSFLAAEGTDEEQTDGIVATETIRLMEENRGKPFFIAAGFYRPHCPYIAPKKYFDLYPLEEIQVPKIDPALTNDAPSSAFNSTRPWPWFGVTELQARESKRAYFATISFVDAQVGRLMAALERLGLAEKTIVVFWSDHGYHLGDHGLWKKMSLFEQSARNPMILAGPGIRGAGRASREPVGLIDLYPTLARWSGLELPGGLDGADLRPLLDNPERAWPRPAFSQVQLGTVPGHSVRTARWRYTEWGRGEAGRQLYDHANDPGESRNLADDPAHAPIVAELRALAHAHWPEDSHSNQLRRPAANRR